MKNKKKYYKKICKIIKIVVKGKIHKLFVEKKNNI